MDELAFVVNKQHDKTSFSRFLHCNIQDQSQEFY